MFNNMSVCELVSMLIRFAMKTIPPVLLYEVCATTLLVLERVKVELPSNADDYARLAVMRFDTATHIIRDHFDTSEEMEKELLKRRDKNDTWREEVNESQVLSEEEFLRMFDGIGDIGQA